MSIEKIQNSNIKLQAAYDKLTVSYQEAKAAQGKLRASNLKLSSALERVTKELADFKENHVLIKNCQKRKSYFAYEKNKRKE